MQCAAHTISGILAHANNQIELKSLVFAFLIFLAFDLCVLSMIQINMSWFSSLIENLVYIFFVVAIARPPIHLFWKSWAPNGSRNLGAKFEKAAEISFFLQIKFWRKIIYACKVIIIDLCGLKLKFSLKPPLEVPLWNFTPESSFGTNWSLKRIGDLLLALQLFSAQRTTRSSARGKECGKISRGKKTTNPLSAWQISKRLQNFSSFSLKASMAIVLCQIEFKVSLVFG